MTGDGGGELKIRCGDVVEIDTWRAAGVASHGRTAVERAVLETLVEKIEVWFADEARIGQKNKINRRWWLYHRARKAGFRF